MRIARSILLVALIFGSLLGRADDDNRFMEYWRANGIPIITAVGVVGVALIVHHGLPQRPVRSGAPEGSITNVQTEPLEPVGFVEDVSDAPRGTSESRDPQDVFVRTRFSRECFYARYSDLQLPPAALAADLETFEFLGKKYLMQVNPEAVNPQELELVLINDKITQPTAKPGTYWAEHPWTIDHARKRPVISPEPDVVTRTDAGTIPPEAL